MGSIGKKLQPELKNNYVDTSKHKVKAEYRMTDNGVFKWNYDKNLWKPEVVGSFRDYKRMWKIKDKSIKK